jgi:hypothetical protein
MSSSNWRSWSFCGKMLCRTPRTRWDQDIEHHCGLSH